MARIIGTQAGEGLSGTEADDYMEGRGGNDFLYGLGGDDRLLGGPGIDHLYGHDGDDILVGGDGTDVVHYFVSESASELRLVDLGNRRADVHHPNGDVDRLYGVEIIQFEAFEDSSQYNVVTNHWDGSGISAGSCPRPAALRRRGRSPRLYPG